MFLAADGTTKLSGRDYEFGDSSRRREQTERSEVFSEKLHGESGESQPTEKADDAEVRADFWPIQGDFICRHHNEPRVQQCAKGRNIPYSNKYLDTTRSTHTDLNVIKKKRVDDCWNVDLNRSLSDSWKGSTKFAPLKESPPKGCMWSGERMARVQTISRPDHDWPEVWTKIGKAAQNREKQKWAKEKPKLDNARRLRGIYFIDPDYQSYKETLKNARAKLERSVAAVMPRKRNDPHDITKVVAKQEIASRKIPKTTCGRMVESHESTR